MLKQKRQMQILDRMREDGEVQISRLAQLFGVAEMTIRRDLDALAQQGLLARTHGGALPQGTQQTRVERPIEPQQITNSEGKRAVARKALSFLCDGITVFFDSGASGLLLAQSVSASHHLTALTNAIPIAMELVTRPSVSVILIGGELKKDMLACRGPVAEESLGRFRVDLAFLGVSAVGRHGELFTGSVAEAGFKKGIIAAADEVIVLADSTKLGRQSLCRFADAQDAGAIITDDLISPEQLSMLRDCGAQVLVAKTNEQRGALRG